MEMTRCDRKRVTMLRRSRVLTTPKTYNFLYFLFFVANIFLPSVVLCQRIVQEEDLNKAASVILSDENGAKIFEGRSDEADHFHGQISTTSHYFLVGARDVLYNISLTNLEENHKFMWSSKEQESCRVTATSEDKCHNYIKVVLDSSGASHYKKFLICGTNSLSPTCRVLSLQQETGNYEFTEEMTGKAKCPADPIHNSTAIFSNNKLFTATTSDLSSRNPLIYSEPLGTQQSDSLWLNEPNFVGSLPHNNFIYFFFRETAIENINCGKVVFSRVARVCPSDKGGERVKRNTWTSFFKSRLNCSLPGGFPFYFDEIQSVSEVGQGNVHSTLTNESSLMLYAVFNTPRNSLRGSAVCGFKMSDITSSFEGKFKHRKSVYSSWLTASDVPRPHPAASCSNDSTTLSDQTLNFIHSHPLMDMAVPSFGGRPVFIQSSSRYALTQVTVDWRILAADHHYYDIIFTGTDDGRVLKSVNIGRGEEISARLIEVISTTSSSPVVKLTIYTDPSDKHKKLLIVTKDKIVSAPLQRCQEAKTCRSCVALRDPYCSWYGNKCTSSHSGLQSLETGRHSKCAADIEKDAAQPSAYQVCQCTLNQKDPKLDKSMSRDVPFAPQTPGNDFQNVAKYERVVYAGMCMTEGEEINCIPMMSSMRSQIALAAILSILISLVVGFALGICFMQRKKVYLYGVSRMNSFRKQVGMNKDYESEVQRKSENYYETEPPSSTSSHRPIIASQYQIRTGPYDDCSDLMQQRVQPPSNSSSFSFITPTFPSPSNPPTPPSIAKLPLKLNILNFVKDSEPLRERPNSIVPCNVEVLHENEELKDDIDRDFPFIDGVQEKEETSFHNLFDVTPTTPVVDTKMYNISVVASDVKPTNIKTRDSFIRQMQNNSFISNSMTKVRSFLTPGNQVQL